MCTSGEVYICTLLTESLDKIQGLCQTRSSVSFPATVKSSIQTMFDSCAASICDHGILLTSVYMQTKTNWVYGELHEWIII